jgi:hypothetical protein
MQPFEEDRKVVDITYNVSELTPQIETPEKDFPKFEP